MMYRAGLVGLGAIAALEWGEPGDKAPYNHAGGIHRSERVKLAAVADLAPERREAFQRKWGRHFPDVKYYNDAVAMCSAEDLDIVSVCVRGPHHLRVMMDVIHAGPKSIFLEKPPTCSLEEMDEITAAAKPAGISITVSYSRHWAPSVLWMEKLIKDGLIGKVTHVIGYCGGSLLSYASHTTDLICQFAGYLPAAVYARGTVAQKQLPAGYEPEPSLTDMMIDFENGVSGLQIGTDGEHGSFYCDVVGTEGRARAGIYTQPYACSKKGAAIDLAQYGIPENASPFTMAYDQIAAHLDGGPLPACTGADWEVVHEIGFAAIESILTGTRVALPSANRARRIYADG
jgi:predicted dehydrogenase